MNQEREKCPHCGGYQMRNGVCHMCGYGKEKYNDDEHALYDIDDSCQVARQHTNYDPINNQHPNMMFNTSQQSTSPNLARCPDCGHIVSLYAVSCPACGRPLIPLRQIEPEMQEPPKRGTNLIRILIGIVLLIIGIYIAYNNGYNLALK